MNPPASRLREDLHLVGRGESSVQNGVEPEFGGELHKLQDVLPDNGQQVCVARLGLLEQRDTALYDRSWIRRQRQRSIAQ